MLKIGIKLKSIWNGFILKMGKGYRFLFSLKLNEILEGFYSKESEFKFIQIGANDGISHDNIYNFVINRKTRGILVEPLNDYYLKLCENYKNYPQIIILNVALHPYLKKVKLYRVNSLYESNLPDWACGIASLDPNHHKKVGIPSEYIFEENVVAKSFDDLMKDYPDLKNIDLIQIDTEGFDFEILKMINFNKFKIKFLKFEHCNLNSDDYKLAKILLKNAGFIFFIEGNDTIAVNDKYDT